MKAVVISGGSGNDALLKGIYSLYPTIDLKVIVNAYDDGKSTGLCRILTNTLGVSDVRKNHARMYRIKNRTLLNGGIVSFFEERFDLPKNKECDFVCSKLKDWGLDCWEVYAQRFFSNQETKNYTFNDFSIANIIYSAMYQYIGYEASNEFICSKLGIPNNVIMNSFENVRLGAKTKNTVLFDEASIVNFSNDKDAIESLTYTSDTPTTINPEAISSIKDADLLIISCGTFWSSIYPTLEYGNLYRAINQSSASKMWIMNNTQDKDSFGVGSNDFLDKASLLGLNVDEFVVLVNEDADDLLRQDYNKFDIVRYSMGNDKGKHDARKLAIAIFKEYFQLRSTEQYKHVLMDFDNTLYSKSNGEYEVSIDNLTLVSKNKKIQIVSGNDYKTAIAPVLKNILGFQNSVWADASSVLYIGGTRCKVVAKHLVNKKTVDFLEKILGRNFGIDGYPNDHDVMSCYKIKPLTPLERRLLINHLNGYVFKAYGIKGLKAVATGRTTVDIVSTKNSKVNIFKVANINPKDCIYIGDETEDYGNDYEIAHECAKYIRVANVYETNIILNVL